MARDVAIAQIEERPVVGRRLDGGVAQVTHGGTRIVRLPERRHAIGHDRVGRQRLQPGAGQHHAEIGARGVDVDPRLVAEGDGGRIRQPVNEPLLAEVVVDHQHTVGRQAITDGAERLLGEHVALEPDPGEARLQRQRVDESEHHQVVLLVRSGADSDGRRR